MTDLNTTNLSDPTSKTSILLWTSTNPKNSFILKKDNKKYLGFPRKDRNGGEYWKFKELREKSLPKDNQPNSNPVMDSLAKFNQRQVKTKEINHGKSNHSDQSISNSQAS